jgi:ABC-2 type transport system ATP-binding protein
MAAIQTRALRKEFGDVVAVDGLDLAVEEGEVFGFLGPNGAGKSTTINMLLGFLTPTGGEATVLGHDVERESVQLRERIGVLPEDFEPYERLTAREHVAYAGGLKGVDPDVEALLERVGLQREAWERPAGDYSTGMAQRLALATALVGDPELLVLDEPSSGLDPEGMGEMRELIRSEAASGTTVFFSSHILSEVEAVCDRVAILSGGSLAVVGSLDDLRAGAVTSASMTLSLSAVPEELVGTVGDLAGVEGVTVDGTELIVELSEATAKVAVVRAADDRVTVEDIVAEETSLESMFSQYANGTGPETAAEPASSEDGVEPTEVAR